MFVESKVHYLKNLLKQSGTYILIRITPKVRSTSKKVTKMPEKIISVPKKPTEATWYIHISNKSFGSFCSKNLNNTSCRTLVSTPVVFWYGRLRRPYQDTTGVPKKGFRRYLPICEFCPRPNRRSPFQ